MSNDYGYINARIRAMKSFLLKEEDYLKGLRQKTADEFVSFLSSLPSYANDVRQVLPGQSTSQSCDQILKLNLCRTFQKIIRFSEGEPRRLILILLAHWDIYNLRTIVRGILGRRVKDEIKQALMPAGKWDLEFLNRLAESSDLKELAKSLSSTAYSGFEKGFGALIADYSLESPLEVLENNFNELFFSKAHEALKKGAKDDEIVLYYLSLQIDLLNILSMLKTVAQIMPKDSLRFIKGGRLSKAFLEHLVTLKSVEEALKEFEGSIYPWLAKEGLELYKSRNRLSSLERLLKNKIFFYCVGLYVSGDPLSIGIPLAYINFKENEVDSLRLIYKAILFGMPESLVKEEAVFA